jgi:hypothetical protein
VGVPEEALQPREDRGLLVVVNGRHAWRVPPNG